MRLPRSLASRDHVEDIEAARKRIEGAVYFSPCRESIPLSEMTGMQIICKLDNLQRTGSFKERGARNALAQLPPEQQKRGVIAASAGNHAQALAYQGKLLGIPATVVMPKFAPLIKIGNCQKLGANVVLHGRDFAEAKAHAHEIGQERGLAYIDGYDDPAIIAGQGTMGLEIVEQVPDLDAVVVPVGGGGLLAGVALAVKSLRPQGSDHCGGSRTRRQFRRGRAGGKTSPNRDPAHARRWPGHRAGRDECVRHRRAAGGPHHHRHGRTDRRLDPAHRGAGERSGRRRRRDSARRLFFRAPPGTGRKTCGPSSCAEETSIQMS